jgi:hypothetical protein
MPTVYTAIMGKYDTLKTPNVVTDGWEYICFTNNKSLKSDFWDIRYIDNKKLSNVMAARCIKIRFFDYIKDDLVIWCDASMLINVNLDDFVEVYHRGNFTTTKHPVRNCIYEEALACLQLSKADTVGIQRQALTYKEDGLPHLQGMIQSGLMIRNNRREVREFCKLWFKELQSHTHRDQLSFNYVLWKHKLIKPFLIDVGVFRREFILGKHGS